MSFSSEGREKQKKARFVLDFLKTFLLKELFTEVNEIIKREKKKNTFGYTGSP